MKYSCVVILYWLSNTNIIALCYFLPNTDSYYFNTTTPRYLTSKFDHQIRITKHGPIVNMSIMCIMFVEIMLISLGLPIFQDYQLLDSV